MIKKIGWVDRKLKFVKVESRNVFEIFWKFSDFWKFRKFSKTWFFKIYWNSFENRKIKFSKIFEIFKNFENFQKISKIFATQLWRFLIFDLLNGSFWSFFMDRSGFSRRIDRIYQNWQQNQLGKVILHYWIKRQLRQETILKQGYPFPVSWNNTQHRAYFRQRTFAPR